MSELTALQNLTKDFVHTYLASQIAAVLRMANGYIYVRLDGIDPKTVSYTHLTLPTNREV